MNSHEDACRNTQVARTAHAIVAAIALATVTMAIAWLCAALFPASLPMPQDPHYIDNIFNSRAVVWAARLVLVAAAFVLAVGGVFIVASAIVHMRNGEWLKRAGPFEVPRAAISDLERQVDIWSNVALRSEQALQALQTRLQATDELFDEPFIDLEEE